jgi:hypothetical protein
MKPKVKDTQEPYESLMSKNQSKQKNFKKMDYDRDYELIDAWKLKEM